MEYQREKYIIRKYVPDDLWNLLTKNYACIAGGAITAAFSRSRIKDLDVYFQLREHREQFLKDVQLYILTKGKDYKQIVELAHTDTAVTYKWGKCILQVITMDRFLKPLEETLFPPHVFDNFDFTVCMGMYGIKQDRFWFHEDFMHHLAAKRLVYNPKSEFPIASLFRLRKYIERGYRVSAMEIVKMALKVHSLPLYNFDALANQLRGIDISYLASVIQELKQRSEEAYDFNTFMIFAEELLENLAIGDDDVQMD